MSGKLKSKKICISIFLLLMLSSACFSQAKIDTKTTMVFSYQDFGPQVIAYELIGFEWYQWNRHGDSDPKNIDDVKVVIYRNISLEKAQEKFPVSQEKNLDHRYLDYDSAIKYLDEYINEPDLEHLKATKKKVVENLGN